MFLMVPIYLDARTLVLYRVGFPTRQQTPLWRQTGWPRCFGGKLSCVTIRRAFSIEGQGSAVNRFNLDSEQNAGRAARPGVGCIACLATVLNSDCSAVQNTTRREPGDPASASASSSLSSVSGLV